MSEMALKGIKVLDFSWVVAGPMVTKFIADYGGTVVRVESSSRPEILRLSPPYKDKKVGVDRSGYFTFINGNKYGISLDLSRPEGIEVVKRLVAWADVAVENFAPGVMEKWGLGYKDLKEINPGIIMLRCSMQGQEGPHSRHPGIGMQLLSFSGFTHFTGWPGGEPNQPFGAYTDFMAPHFAVSALIAALLYRRRTGKGQCLDLSQNETAIHFLAPLMLDYTVNGREGSRQGNSCAYAAPHAVYRCQGEDRWCVITVFTDEKWRAFCQVLGNPGWSKEARFNTVLGRKKNETALNGFIEEWTLQRTAEEVVALMQAAKIPSGVVQTAEDLYLDPQLGHRNNLWPMEHKELGTFSHLGQSAVLSKTPAVPRMPAPCLGEHTEYVCRELLGMSGEEFDRLLVEGIFT